MKKSSRFPCPIRIWRSPWTDFAPFPADDTGDESCHAVDAYTETELENIAKQGFNGIWVHALIHHIVAVEPFPELGKHATLHQEKLNLLIQRAAKYQIKVYLYMQGLRAIPLADQEFWDRHGAFGGQMFQSSRALCISTPEVKLWLENAFLQMTRKLVDLGGVILITASELPSHCWYGYRPECPRCADRKPADVVVDVLSAIHKGIRRESKEMQIIVWNWSWRLLSWGYQAPFREIIGNLPSDLTIMADFERGGKMDLWEHPGMPVDEYCLNYAGPSEDCRETLRYARRRGMKTMVKLQVGTTHELASVVSLPLLLSVLRKAVYCREEQLDGFMGCWNFGNFQSANTEGFLEFLSQDSKLREEKIIEAFLLRKFPGCDPEMATQACLEFSKAMFFYPFSQQFIYNGPVNYTLAYSEVFRVGPVGKESCGPSHLSVQKRGDNLSRAVVCDTANDFRPEDMFSLDEVIRHLKQLVPHWRDAAEKFRKAMEKTSSESAALEVNNALLIACVWESLLHTFEAYKLKLYWEPGATRRLNRIILSELNVLKRALVFVEKDPRQGWHAEANDYLFSSALIQKKIRLLSRRHKRLLEKEETNSK